MVRTAVLCALLAAMVVSPDPDPPPVALASACPPAAVAVGDYANYEGTGQGVRAFTFLVAVTPAPGCAATGSVQVSTADGTAVAPGDYQATTATLTWNGDSAPRSVTVAVVADSGAEPDEGFSVVLSAPVNLTVTSSVATGTVLDDDDPPQRTGVDGGKICWAIDRAGDSVCRVEVRTSSPVRAPVTVRFRTIAVDGKPVGYEPVRDGMVTIPVGSTTGFAEIRLLPGPRPAEERFAIELSEPSAGVLGAARALVTIRGR